MNGCARLRVAQRNVSLNGGFRADVPNTRKPKLPFAIAMKDGHPFTFAGLWENWKDPDSGEWLRTCTVITGEPNVAQIHPRMPEILPEKHHAAWLGETEDGNLKELLLPTLPIRCECGKFLRG